MRRQPSFALPKKFFQLVPANPIMLLRIEHRNQYIQMRKQVLQSHIASYANGEVRTRSPLRKLFVKWMMNGVHGVSEWFKQTAQERITASARDRRNSGFKIHGLIGERLAFLTPAAHRGPEHIHQRHAVKGRRRVWTVVHVLIQRTFAGRIAASP